MDEIRRRQLFDSGYCLFEGVLDKALLEELRLVTDGLLAAQTPEQVERFRYQGSNISVAYQHPVFARLFAWSGALECLAQLGFDDPRWWSGFLLSKPPYGPPLYWHQDWWAWDDPCSGGQVPPQIFLMYYLTDTNRENGCLRLIPGSHRRRLPLHDQLPPAHSEQTYGAPLDSPIFAFHADEVDVPVRAGDLVVGDARMLHAAHANRTGRLRSLLTLWYFPAYSSLPESIQAFVCRKKPLEPPDWWEGEHGAPVEKLLPRYEGAAEPARWNRIPGVHLAGGLHQAQSPQ